jgi:hypothetical protein
MFKRSSEQQSSCSDHASGLAEVVIIVAAWFLALALGLLLILGLSKVL